MLLFISLGKTKEESIRELIRSIKETSADFDVKLTEDSTEFTFEPGHIVQSGAFYITDPVFQISMFLFTNIRKECFQKKCHFAAKFLQNLRNLNRILQQTLIINKFGMTVDEYEQLNQ